MQTYDTILRGQYTSLIVATALAGLGTSYLGLGTWLRLNLPTLPGDAALGFGVVLLGYAVARYNALLEGRRIEGDFSYAVLAVGSLTAFYVLITLLLHLQGLVSFLALALTIVGALSFNSLYDGVRVTLDRLFYHGQFEQLRANLRALAREAGTGPTLPGQLQAILTGLCHTMGVRKGVIALKNEDQFTVVATQGVEQQVKDYPPSALISTETIGLVRPVAKGIEGMALLVPLFAGNSQIGALVLGQKGDRQPYGEQDLELLDDLADQIAGIIHARQMQEENAKTINAMVSEFRARERSLQLHMQQMLAERKEEPKAVFEGVSEDELVRLVEEGLRRLYDFPYLGEHALTKFQVTKARLERLRDGAITFIDRGKAVNEVLLQALQKLRPGGTEPDARQVPLREWHYFVILNDSYVLGEPNRDIMGRLYIGEGTFNRTRRRALRSVAKALLEMEQEASRNPA